jgi:hypothetical protein
LRFLVIVFLASCVAGASTAAAWATERVSVSSDEEQALGASGDDFLGVETVAVSADGRFVAFTSGAANLVPGDTNGKWDVFVRDRQTDVTELISVASSERQGNRKSNLGVAISATGRFVAFGSAASNLVRNDTNRATDVFVRDRTRGTTRRVSVTSLERQFRARSYAPSISADGRMVAFTSGLIEQIYVRDRASGVTRRVSIAPNGEWGNDSSRQPAISADGRFIAFSSGAWNLVRGPDATGSNADIFIRNLVAGWTRMVSVDSDEKQLIERCSDGGKFSPVIDEDGSHVAFTLYQGFGDVCGVDHVFLRNRAAGLTRRIDVAPIGEPDGSSGADAISADGNLVLFHSAATNLVAHDGNDKVDLFLHDVGVATTTRVSVSATGGEANDVSWQGALAGTGILVAFASLASDLVADDTNERADVFARALD